MSRQSGFTLIELLVAATLLGLLAAALAGGVRFGARAWDTVDRSLDRGESVVTAQRVLRRALERALPPAPPDGGFAGYPDHVEFIAALPERVAAPGLDRVAVYLRSGRLDLAWASPDRRGTDGRKTLLDGVAAGDFSYYGSPDGQEAASWHDHWTAAPTLPRMIALRLRLADSATTWPLLEIALPAEPDAPAATP